MAVVGLRKMLDRALRRGYTVEYFEVVGSRYDTEILVAGRRSKKALLGELIRMFGRTGQAYSGPVGGAAEWALPAISSSGG